MNRRNFAICVIIVASLVVVGVVFVFSSKKQSGNLQIYAVQSGYDGSGRHYTMYSLIWYGAETNITLNYVPFGTWTMHMNDGKTFSETAKEPYPCFITYDGTELRLDP